MPTKFVSQFGFDLPEGGSEFGLETESHWYKPHIVINEIKTNLSSGENIKEEWLSLKWLHWNYITVSAQFTIHHNRVL